MVCGGWLVRVTDFNCDKFISSSYKMLFLKLFLLFFVSQTFHANNVKKCGKYPIESLQIALLYKSYKSGAEPLQIKISEPIDHKKVSVGYFTAPNGLVNCVAVKFMSGREAGDGNLFVKSHRIMERIQQNLPKEERMHLIEMIDAGYTTPYGEGALIMELGDESFAERLYWRSAVHYQSDRDLMGSAGTDAGAIRKFSQPLVEFHKIAVHMDVNPRNYLYVLDNGRTVLKLIDFEGAQYISSSNPNESVVVGVHAFTPEYTAPEYYDVQSRQISPKFDIWSVGMIVFEILIHQLRAARGEEPMQEAERNAMLRNIGNLYLGFTRNRFGNNPGTTKETQILYTKCRNWVGQNSDAIYAVLQLWRKFPETALLVTNLLHFERKKRLTAQGILDYIDGLCHIEELKSVRKSKKLRIFNSLLFGKFEIQQQSLWMIKTDRTGRRPSPPADRPPFIPSPNMCTHQIPNPVLCRMHVQFPPSPSHIYGVVVLPNSFYAKGCDLMSGTNSCFEKPAK
uniref:Protein kinase domain-containing protein n=1 Tax=Globodera rostochiensis TaxID=31243 RepID=A0A914HMS0_GLORO